MTAGSGVVQARMAEGDSTALPRPKLTVKELVVTYGTKRALGPVTMDIGEKKVTALIGPSGCGKSTFLRSLNRMNDLVPGANVAGDVRLEGQPIYGPGVDPVV